MKLFHVVVIALGSATARADDAGVAWPDLPIQTSDVRISRESIDTANCRKAQFYQQHEDELARCSSDATKAKALSAAARSFEATFREMAELDGRPKPTPGCTPPAKIEPDPKAVTPRAGKSLSELESARRAEAQNKLADATRALQLAIDAARAHEPSVDGFEQLAVDPKRLEACVTFREARLVLLDPSEKANFEHAEAAAKAAPVTAHAMDLLRKAQGLANGALQGNGLADQVGSADHVLASVLASFGADSKTTGFQTVLTLNVASLFSKSEAERLKSSVFWRNVNLRAVLPLSATASPTAPTGDMTLMSATTLERAGRFSVSIGGSFFDEADQRLPSHEACYRGVVEYVAFREEAAGETDALRAERKDYFDVCDRIAAYSSRLAWRVGMGFVSDKTDGTRAELLGLAVVWAPQPWFYVNVLGQVALLPTTSASGGVGLSLGRNVGGSSTSGVDAWGRIGLDVQLFGTYVLPTAALPNKIVTTDMRFNVSFRGKLFGNSVGTVAFGPSFPTEDLGHPVLLATVALSYDADTLIDQVLTPRP
jgi:hypothetical protein